MFSEQLLFFSWIVKWVEGTLDVQIFVGTFALIEVFEERLPWHVVVGIVWAFEHVLTFDDLLSSLQHSQVD